MQNLCAWSAELPFWSRDVLLGRVCKPADGIRGASRMPFDLLVARVLEQLGLETPPTDVAEALYALERATGAAQRR